MSSHKFSILTGIVLLGQAGGQQTLPIDLQRAFVEAKPLIAMLEVDWPAPEPPSFGAGVLIGYDASFIYGITASHVVWRGAAPAQSPRIYLQLKTSGRGRLQHGLVDQQLQITQGCPANTLSRGEGEATPEYRQPG